MANSNSAQAAKRLLSHYMRMLARNSGVNWDSDNDTEVELIVDYIVEAATQKSDTQAEADEMMAEHRDNRRRAKEQMDGLRRGMGLDTDAEAEARTDYADPLN